MSASPLLHTLFKYKAWANEELFVELEKLDPEAHQAQRHAAIRVLNHIYVVDRIFAAHLAGAAHNYADTNTPQTPTLEELRVAVAASDLWYVEYVANLSADLLAEKLPFMFTDASNGFMSREEMLAHVATHGGYHRGAVGRIMAQLSVAPPRDSLSVYLHRSEPERRLQT